MRCWRTCTWLIKRSTELGRVDSLCENQTRAPSTGSRQALRDKGKQVKSEGTMSTSTMVAWLWKNASWFHIYIGVVLMVAWRSPKPLVRVRILPSMPKDTYSNSFITDCKSVASWLRRCKSCPPSPLWGSREVVKPDGPTDNVSWNF